MINNAAIDSKVSSTGKEENFNRLENFPLDTERGYHVLFENNEKLINRPIGWSQFGFYIIQIEEGIRSAGTVEIAGLDNKPNQKRLKMIEKETRKILPILDKVKSTWLGFRPTLPDAMPVIGPSVKNKKVIEKDREKTREEWKKMMDKEDAKFLDELASIRFVMNKRDEKK